MFQFAQFLQDIKNLTLIATYQYLFFVCRTISTKILCRTPYVLLTHYSLVKGVFIDSSCWSAPLENHHYQQYSANWFQIWFHLICKTTLRQSWCKLTIFLWMHRVHLKRCLFCIYVHIHFRNLIYLWK